MIRAFRAFCAVAILAAVTACAPKEPPAPGASFNKFRDYYGPRVTQVLVKKEARKMYLLHGRQVLREYRIDLGNQPVGHKTMRGDGKTPEGIYFIDRRNANSRYHLSVGVSYPNPNDRQQAESRGVHPGGDIFIHGRGPEGNSAYRRDWTAGCIAVSDGEIEEIYSMLNNRVPVVIVP